MATPPDSLTFDSLAAMTNALEHDVPSIRGSFPDFAQLGAQLAATGGRRSTYVLGTIKSGKSTFLSALIAADVLPRGSGVKTFNISRVRAAEARSAVVRFKSRSQMQSMLSFDFRMLGMAVDVPEDLYAPQAVGRIAALYAEFEKQATEDGRLDYLAGRGDEQGFLTLALARVRLTIACLTQLHRDTDASTLATLREKCELSFEGERFEAYLRWAGAPEFAVVIQEIEVALPFPPTLPEGALLVDCQGSDSLNPLDFASVDAALHRADRIFYVVNSRLGLRLADRDLLLHAQRAGLAEKAALIYNVEAYEPLPAPELEKMQSKLHADLEAMKLGGIQVFTVCALLELFKSDAARTTDVETMRGIWKARGHDAVLAQVEAGFAKVRQQLAEMAETATTPARVFPLLLSKAQTTAKALLARDRQMFGLQSTELDEKEMRTAIHRILEGEKAELAKKLQKSAYETFEAGSRVQTGIDQFLKAGVSRLQQEHPLPDALKSATKHGGVQATALEVFNTEWTLFENKLRIQLINPFIEKGFAVVLDSLSQMYRLIPGVFGSKLSELSSEQQGHALPSHDAVLSGLREYLDRLALQIAVPEVLRPVVLMPVIANGLAGEFYARRAFTVLKAKITRKEAPAEANLAKTQKLWDRTLLMALKAGKEDQEFSVSSARENFRFQYFGKIVEVLFARFQEVVLQSVDRYFADVRRLDAASKLLLNGAERQRIEAYLRAL